MHEKISPHLKDSSPQNSRPKYNNEETIIEAKTWG